MKACGFRLPEELIDALEAIAETRGQDKSALVREILVEGIKNRGGKISDTESRLSELENRVAGIEHRLSNG